MTDPLLRPFDKERLPTIRRHGYWRQPVPGSEANNTELQYEDWRNEKILGRGTYGTVRLVRSAQDEKKMRAVKEVFKINTPTALASRELQALIALQKHPEHFVKFFGWWEDDECFYFAMEYIEKGDLMSLLKDNKLTEMDARTIAKQILEGLQTMHQNHICHRDVKPDNILAISWLPGPLRVKLTDFGCAKFGAGTGLRTTIGTVGYMAPEVLGYDDDQETSNYTYEADIWSLGCVIYYVMTRKLPLVGFRSYMKYIRGQIPLPSEKLIQNGVSQSGIDFISMLMSPDRDKRPSAKMALQHEWLYAVTAEKKSNPARVSLAGEAGVKKPIVITIYPESHELPSGLRECAPLSPLVHQRSGHCASTHQLLRITPPNTPTSPGPRPAQTIGAVVQEIECVLRQ